MLDQERFKILSNSYADLIHENTDTSDFLNKHPNATVHKIDEHFSVFHIPAQDFTEDSIVRYGYSAIPHCYGLVTSPSLLSSGVNKIREIPNLNLKGQGVLLGFVDTGIDYLNPAFLRKDKTSRILSIWDQTIDSSKYPPNFYYGTEYTLEDLNQALASQDPYSIVPSMDYIGHGTILASIAAGSELTEEDFSGVAPNTDILVVKLKETKPLLKQFYEIPPSAISYQSNDIMFGVKYLIDEANRLRRPIAICLGIGSSLGDYGIGPLSLFLSYYSDSVGTAIVVPTGNEANRGHHYYREIAPSIGYDIVELNVAQNNPGFLMELYVYPPANFKVEVYSPLGDYVTSIPETNSPLSYSKYTIQNTTLHVNNISRENVDEHFIVFRFQNPIAGIWRIFVSEELDLITKFRIYLPISPFIPPDTFFHQSDNNTTLTAPGSVEKLITATAYNPVNESLYYYAGRGFTVFNMPKPDIAAPGVTIFCPLGNESNNYVTGSSVAAAHTAGVAALFLELGVVRGLYRNINTSHIQRIFIYSARRKDYLIYPNPEWGYGILDIYNAYVLFMSEITIPSN